MKETLHVLDHIKRFKIRGIRVSNKCLNEFFKVFEVDFCQILLFSRFSRSLSVFKVFTVSWPTNNTLLEGPDYVGFLGFQNHPLEIATSKKSFENGTRGILGDL